MHAQNLLVGDHKRADIQRCPRRGRNPILVDGDKLPESFHQKLLVELGHNQAFAGGVQAFKVLTGAEKLNFSFGGTIRLHALKYFLRIVKTRRRRVHRDRPIRHNARIMPALARSIVHQEHVVSKDMAKAEVVLIGLGLGMIGQRDLDLHHIEHSFIDCVHCIIKFFSIIARIYCIVKNFTTISAS